jgi:hypothetical protein
MHAGVKRSSGLHQCVSASRSFRIKTNEKQVKIRHLAGKLLWRLQLGPVGSALASRSGRAWYSDTSTRVAFR